MSKSATQGKLQLESRAWNGANEFKTAVREWAERLNVKPERIQLQVMTKKWASCSGNGIVTFNKNLLEKDRRFGEAVIVHELIHLTVRNHGRLFRSLLRAHMPEAEAILTEHGMEA